MALTETTHDAGFLLSEGNRTLSRKNAVLLSGQNLAAGAVLGQVNRIQAAAPIPTISGTGTGAMTALSFGPDIQVGAYTITLTATSATSPFTVLAPDGTYLANGAVGTAYVSTHFNFLISSAGTMTLGDSFTLTVTAAGTPVLVGTGTGLVSSISLGPDAQVGGYRVQLLATSATGEFEVIAPDGTKLRRGQVATAYTSSHVNFTLANGGTMTSGDYFNLIVANGSKYVAWTPGTFDGRHIAAGVLLGGTNATSADKACVVVHRDAECNTNELVWPSVNTAVKASGAAQLAARGIFVR